LPGRQPCEAKVKKLSFAQGKGTRLSERKESARVCFVGILKGWTDEDPSQSARGLLSCESCRSVDRSSQVIGWFSVRPLLFSRGENPQSQCQCPAEDESLYR
jgi:hypothetical protein